MCVQARVCASFLIKCLEHRNISYFIEDCFYEVTPTSLQTVKFSVFSNTTAYHMFSLAFVHNRDTIVSFTGIGSSTPLILLTMMTSLSLCDVVFIF